MIRVPGGIRHQLQECLNWQGIRTGIHYPIALPFLNAYKHLGHVAEDFPQASQTSGEILSLPMFPELTAGQIAHVADAIANASCLRT